MAFDPAGNVFVVGGFSENVFKTALDGTITEVLDETGGGLYPGFDPSLVVTDAAGNLYVTGYASDNALKVTPGGVVTEIIDVTGDGAGHLLRRAGGIALDASGNVYVAGGGSNNVFHITPGGVKTQILGPSGSGPGAELSLPDQLAVDRFGNAYVSGFSSMNVFKVTPEGAISLVLDETGDGNGNTLMFPSGVDIDSTGALYVAAGGSYNVFEVTTSAGGSPRNGSGSNPTGFEEVTQAILGTSWETTVDLGGADASIVWFFQGGPLPGRSLAYGELLCAPPILGRDVAFGSHAIPLPNNPSFLGLELSTQAAALTFSPSLTIQLQNALDIRVGSY